MADFGAKMDELGAMVGDGILEGTLEVDQVYAAPIERGFWETGPLAGHTNHPRHGGETHFLEHSLRDGFPVYMQRLADGTLEIRGLHDAMVDNVEDLSASVSVRAPVLFENLRRSGHPTVTDNGAVVYDRPPIVHRLTRAEIAALNESIEGPDGQWGD